MGKDPLSITAKNEGLASWNLYIESLEKLFAQGVNTLLVGANVLLTGTIDTGPVLSIVSSTFSTARIKVDDEFYVWRYITTAALSAVADGLGNFGKTHVTKEPIDPKAAKRLSKELKKHFKQEQFIVTIDIFERPEKLAFLKQTLDLVEEWVTEQGFCKEEVGRLLEDINYQFLKQMVLVGRTDREGYQALESLVNSRFFPALIKKKEWDTYGDGLKLAVTKSLPGEPFNLSQIYVPLNAYSEANTVVAVDDCLDQWAEDQERPFCIVAGGPGSGKSTVAKMLASRLVGKTKTLLIPLMDIENSSLNSGFEDCVNHYIKKTRVFSDDVIPQDERLLIIFDGLDELSTCGDSTTQAVRTFVSNTATYVKSVNRDQLTIKVLFTGREIVTDVLKNRDDLFNTIHLLPYFNESAEDFSDPDGLLLEDKRDTWWRKYGELTDKDYQGLPENLKAWDEKENLTLYPMLNYLLAITCDDESFGSDKDMSLSGLYSDILRCVFNRQYGKPESGDGKHPTVQDLSLKDYEWFLEEAALLTWQQRSLSENIEILHDKCTADKKLSDIFDTIKNENGKGIENLLIAFFFKQERKHFEFSHKSFQEYLVASKAYTFLVDSADIMVAVEDFATKWLDFFGPMRMTEHMIEFLFSFLNTNNNSGSLQLVTIQSSLAKLTEFAITSYFPVDKLAERLPYPEELAMVKNAKNSLLDVLCNVSSILERHPPIYFGDKSDFLHLHQSLIDKPYESVGANRSWLDLSECYLNGVEFAGMCLAETSLIVASLAGASLIDANLSGADLTGANLSGANFQRADLIGANLSNANLSGANLTRAGLIGANLSRADLAGAGLICASLYRANLAGANLAGADLVGANFQRADFRHSNITVDQLQNLYGSPIFDKTTKFDKDIWDQLFPDDEWPWDEAC